MTTVEIIRTTMNSTTDHQCNKTKVPVITHRAGKDNMTTKNINTINKVR